MQKDQNKGFLAAEVRNGDGQLVVGKKIQFNNFSDQLSLAYYHLMNNFCILYCCLHKNIV